MGNILNDGKKLELEQNYIFWPALIFSVCYIALFIWLGFYQWPQADDWSMGINIQIKGESLFKFVVDNYNNWSGRIVAFAFYWLFMQLPFNLYWLYVIITLAMYGLASYYLVSVLCEGFKFKIKLLLTLIIVAVSLSLMEYSEPQKQGHYENRFSQGKKHLG